MREKGVQLSLEEEKPTEGSNQLSTCSATGALGKQEIYKVSLIISIG
jgi:hypothetical protein